MTGDGADQIDRDQHLSGTPEDAASVAVEAHLVDLHTHLPGIVKAYDPASQTVTVQPAYNRIFTELGEVPLPQVVDCPVFFPGGGPLVSTWPIAAGDECLLAVAERAIDAWFQSGDVQTPSEPRKFDLSDCFAFVGFSSQKRFIQSVNPSAFELRTRDGALILRFASGKISLGVSSPEPVPGGNTLKDLLGQLIDAIKAITVPTAVGPSGVPINAAAFDAVKNQLSTMLSSKAEVQL